MTIGVCCWIVFVCGNVFGCGVWGVDGELLRAGVVWSAVVFVFGLL